MPDHFAGVPNNVIMLADGKCTAEGIMCITDGGLPVADAGQWSLELECVQAKYGSVPPPTNG